ncbi:MAG TPA: class I SAM-dependent methyltransferase [Thermomicrobiales bacterium]|nr:class I SAM-dependent methyltransferase [Thermomicrobiales bacterium]
MGDFDAVAPQFETHRALPGEVAPLIRDAVWQATSAVAGRLVLEIGAGTGRIGHAFQAAGDAYVGMDLSRGMLDAFVARERAGGSLASQLVQGDGRALPFADDTFDAVLLVQVLSGQREWREVLGEAQRVLRPGGGLVLGRTVPPADGVDRRMRAQLTAILAGLRAPTVPVGARMPEAVAWLAPQARWHTHVIAAAWDQERSPSAFLARQPSGARFAALPAGVQATALARLEAWACATFGGLDASASERWEFEIDVFMF